MRIRIRGNGISTYIVGEMIAQFFLHIIYSHSTLTVNAYNYHISFDICAMYRIV
jgi:hypothetical protein